ncbi:hypothetical protein ABW21_db0204759 [Orbilia brochopaga]|nr:hypothetical protein ABW21_db0204759 [Drechslerella brochopaga]
MISTARTRSKCCYSAVFWLAILLASHASAFYMVPFNAERESWWSGSQVPSTPLRRYRNNGNCYQLPPPEENIQNTSDGDILPAIIIYNAPGQNAVKEIGFWTTDNCDGDTRSPPDFAVQLDPRNLIGAHVILARKIAPRLQLRGRSFRAIVPTELAAPDSYLYGFPLDTVNGNVFVWRFSEDLDIRQPVGIESYPDVVGYFMTPWWLPEVDLSDANLFLRDIGERLLNPPESLAHPLVIPYSLQAKVTTRRRGELIAEAAYEGRQLEELYRPPIPPSILGEAPEAGQDVILAPSTLDDPNVYQSSREIGPELSVDGGYGNSASAFNPILPDFSEEGDRNPAQLLDQISSNVFELPVSLEVIPEQTSSDEDAIIEEPIPVEIVNADSTAAIEPIVEGNGNQDPAIYTSFVDYDAPPDERVDEINFPYQPSGEPEEHLSPMQQVASGDDQLSTILSSLSARIRDPAAQSARDKTVQILSTLDSLLDGLQQAKSQINPPIQLPVQSTANIGGNFNPLNLQQTGLLLDINNPSAGLAENEALLNSLNLVSQSNEGSNTPPLRIPPVRGARKERSRNAAVSAMQEQGPRFGGALDDEEEERLLIERYSYLQNKRLKREQAAP